MHEKLQELTGDYATYGLIGLFFSTVLAAFMAFKGEALTVLQLLGLQVMGGAVGMLAGASMIALKFDDFTAVAAAVGGTVAPNIIAILLAATGKKTQDAVGSRVASSIDKEQK